jgi:hypothetical protein
MVTTEQEGDPLMDNAARAALLKHAMRKHFDGAISPPDMDQVAITVDSEQMTITIEGVAPSWHDKASAQDAVLRDPRFAGYEVVNNMTVEPRSD